MPKCMDGAFKEGIAGLSMHSQLSSNLIARQLSILLNFRSIVIRPARSGSMNSFDVQILCNRKENVGVPVRPACSFLHEFLPISPAKAFW